MTDPELSLTVSSGRTQVGLHSLTVSDCLAIEQTGGGLAGVTTGEAIRTAQMAVVACASLRTAHLRVADAGVLICCNRIPVYNGFAVKETAGRLINFTAGKAIATGQLPIKASANLSFTGGPVGAQVSRDILTMCNCLAVEQTTCRCADVATAEVIRA